MLIDEICEYLLPLASDHRAVDVRVGLGYTAVRLERGSCGLAYTFRDEAQECCSVLHGAGAVAGRPASELIGWARSLDVIAAAVGLATLNALVEPPAGACELDLLNLLDVRPDDTVGMVGYFGPFVEILRGRARSVSILERHPRNEPGVLPDWAAGVVLPGCQVVLISATTFLNRTIDHLLELARNAREVAIVGPSTPLAPEIFARYGVTVLSGVQVIDPDRVLRIVSEGGGTRQFGKAVRKLTIRLPERRNPAETAEKALRLFPNGPKG